MQDLSERWSEAQFSRSRAVPSLGEDEAEEKRVGHGDESSSSCSSGGGGQRCLSKLYKSHPSVQFYGGRQAVVLRGVDSSHVAASGSRGEEQVTEATANAGSSAALHVMEVHRFLLPDGCGIPGSSEGLPGWDARWRALQNNWRPLMNILLPTVSPSAYGDSESLAAVLAAKRVDAAQRVRGEGLPSADAEEALAFQAAAQIDFDVPLDARAWQELRGDGSLLLDRVLYSYNAIVGFFGWRVHRDDTGELDRHSGWRERYRLLERYTAVGTATTAPTTVVGAAVHPDCTSLPFESTCFYHELTRIIRVLIELRMNIYAVHLVTYIVEEMSKGRLCFLRRLLDTYWLPQIHADRRVPGHVMRTLTQKYLRLDASDSD